MNTENKENKKNKTLRVSRPPKKKTEPTSSQQVGQEGESFSSETKGGTLEKTKKKKITKKATDKTITQKDTETSNIIITRKPPYDNNSPEEVKKYRKILNQEYEQNIANAKKLHTLRKLYELNRQNPDRKNDNLYKLVADVPVLMNSYEKLKKNKGSMTKGTDISTADEWSIDRFEKAKTKTLRRFLCLLPCKKN